MAYDFKPIPEADLQRFVGIAQALGRGRPAFGFGQQASRAVPGPGLEFKDFRDYIAGEDSGRIDWRASHRSGTTLVRQHHSELSANWLLCLDNSASMGVPSWDKWSLAAQVTNAFAYLLMQAGHQVGLLRFSERIDHYLPCAAGHSHYLRLLQGLRSAQPNAEGGGSAISCIHSAVNPSTHLAIISDCLMPRGLTHELLSLAGPGRAFRLAQLLSPDEVYLPGTDTLELVDSETGQHQSVSVSQQDHAQGKLSELRQSLAAFCRRAQIPFSSTLTSLSWQQVLQEQYRATLHV